MFHWFQPMLAFPADFLWGVSTSAHQFEGQNTVNQWAAWERQGRIRSGDFNRDACDWWRESRRDLDLCRELRTECPSHLRRLGTL